MSWKDYYPEGTSLADLDAWWGYDPDEDEDEDEEEDEDEGEEGENDD